jgi:hypothetical protein
VLAIELSVLQAREKEEIYYTHRLELTAIALLIALRKSETSGALAGVRMGAPPTDTDAALALSVWSWICPAFISLLISG